MLSTRSLEKITKGFSNHRRIQILALLGDKPNLSGFEISEELKVNFKTISEHVRRLFIAGLVKKKSEGTIVRHKLSDLGQYALKFLRAIG